MNKSVTFFLIEVGIPTNLLGFDYLETAVLFCLNNSPCRNFSKELYPYLAKVHNAKHAQIERNIRTAIEQAYNRKKLQRINTLFDSEIYNGQCPTAKEFITLAARWIILSGLAN